jgi:hypothetical protein
MHSTLEDLWRRCEKREVEDIEKEITALLSEHGRGLRRDDGILFQINLSVPQTRNNDLVIGLRYKKRDESFTEDHFLCITNEGDGNLKIQPKYGKSLEKVLVEYRGAHKYQLGQSDFDKGPIVTQVNTISFMFNRY